MTISMPEVDRAAASRRAVEMRRRRAAVKDSLRSAGGHSEMLRRSGSHDDGEPSSTSPEEILTLRVTDFVQTLPNVGPKKTDEILHRAGVSDKKRLGGLGSRQRAALLDEVEAVEKAHEDSLHHRIEAAHRAADSAGA